MTTQDEGKGKGGQGVGENSQSENIGLSSLPPGYYTQGAQRNFLIFLTLSLITLTHAFESTCLCVTLPTIANDLNASVSESLSFGTTFLLAMALIQPFSSEFSQVIGRRPAFLLSILIFIVGTIICALARSPIVLLVGRTIQGAGAGATEPVKALILYDLFSLRERSKWVSFLNISWALGTISGPLLGGLFTARDDITWRWIFWINLPLLGLSFVAGLGLLGYDDAPKLSWKLIGRVDWGGLTLFLLSGTAFLAPLTYGGSTYPWSSAQVVAPLILGIVGFVTLGCYQAFLAKNPVFRPSLFRNYSTVIQYFNVVLHGLLMWMILYYVSLYYLSVRNSSPFQTGIWILPATLTVAPLAMVVGVVVHRTGHYRTFLLGGWAATVITFGVLNILDVKTPDGGLIGINLLAGLSFGVLVPGMAVGIQSTVKRSDSGQAICLTLLMRPAGQCLGIAVGLAVFSTELKKAFVRNGLGEALAQDFMKHARRNLDPETPDMDEETASQIPKIIELVVEALRAVWITGASLAGLALILTCCAKCPRLPDDRKGEPREDAEERVGGSDQQTDGEASAQKPQTQKPDIVVVDSQITGPKEWSHESIQEQEA